MYSTVVQYHDSRLTIHYSTHYSRFRLVQFPPRCFSARLFVGVELGDTVYVKNYVLNVQAIPLCYSILLAIPPSKQGADMFGDMRRVERVFCARRGRKGKERKGGRARM